MFHKVVWQHMQHVVGFLIKTTANLPSTGSLPVKNFKNRFHSMMAMRFWPHFFGRPGSTLSSAIQHRGVSTL